MKKVRQKGTDLEQRVSRLLFATGARYRLNVSDLPGRPDIASKSRRKAIFVNGCYWHHHTVCARGQVPSTNPEFWREKFKANRRRDQRKVQDLKDLGFDVLVVWECELQDEDLLQSRLVSFWSATRNGTQPDHEGPQPGLGAAQEPLEDFRLDVDNLAIVRTVGRRDGRRIESVVPIDEPVVTDDLAAEYDRAWLRGPRPRSLRGRRQKIRLVDLFSGCGGMSVGVAESCRALGYRLEPVLALDTDPDALEVYSSNFPGSDTVAESIEATLPGNPGDDLNEAELAFQERLGDIDLVVGGPPCQGNSDLNNHTRRQDPKNELFYKMARFAEVVGPDHLIIENVNGVLHDSRGVFERTEAFLRDLEYDVAHGVLHAERFGVPQSRRRVFMVASRTRTPDLDRLIDAFDRPARDVDWAIRDLLFARSESSYDEPSKAAKISQERMDYLFEHRKYDLPNERRPECHQDGDHSYTSVYGRLHPDRPAPTITTGFTSMGQGRFVHPHRRRTLTPHEAARLQFFPDHFEFGERNRTTYTRLIGNAVPAKLTYVIALDLLR